MKSVAWLWHCYSESVKVTPPGRAAGRVAGQTRKSLSLVHCCSPETVPMTWAAIPGLTSALRLSVVVSRHLRSLLLHKIPYNPLTFPIEDVKLRV